MKKLLVAGVAVAALCGVPALAADMAVKAPPPAVAAPVYSWTGCYLGASGGGSWAQSSTTTVINDPTDSFAGPASQVVYNATMSPRLDPKGYIIGGQIGCNYQTGALVLGAETDFSDFDLNGSAITAVAPVTSALTSTTSVSTNWLWTGRLRAGLAFDRTLLYATGGAAAAKLNYSQSNYFAACGGTVCTENAAASATKLGWVVGGGVEYALTANWTIKGEYLYMQFNNFSTSALVMSGGVSSVPFNHTADLNVSTVRGGVNYKF